MARNIDQSWLDVKKSMLSDGFEPDAIARFEEMYRAYGAKSDAAIPWQELAPLALDDAAIYNHQTLDHGASNLDYQRVAVCKLNGGLGTSMGCGFPKSLVEVCSGLHFLNVIVAQLQALNQQHATSVPLLLMNSFSTESATRQALKIDSRVNDAIEIQMFQQNKFPRIVVENLSTLAPELGEQRYYPPGHGDVYYALARSGLLDRLLAQGRDILFISNSDNLGATLDPKLLHTMIADACDFMIELTPKTENDVKGGTIVRRCMGGQMPFLTLLEIAQVETEHLDAFQSRTTFPLFNTNNLWINLRALKEKLNAHALKMPLIANYKTVADSEVVQLENAMGAAIASFEKTRIINVDRTRFFPVKTTNDLFLLRSNLFHYDAGVFERRVAEMPVVRLGDCFRNVTAFEKRIDAVPDLRGLTSLHVKGDVYFSKAITLRGNIVIDHDGCSDSLTIPEGCVLEDGRYTAADFCN